MVRQTTVAHMLKFAGILIDCLSLVVLAVAPPSGETAESTSRFTIYFSNDLLPQSTRRRLSAGDRK
jgi:hypothetical protein